MGSIIGMLLSIIIKIHNALTHVSMLYMDYWDALLVTFVVWLLCSNAFQIHSGISLLIGVAIAIPLWLLFKNRIGFWIVTPIFSYIWTWFFIEIILISFFSVDFDKIWYAIAFIAVFAYNCYKHWFAVGRPGIVWDDNDLNPQKEKEDMSHIIVDEVWYDPIAGVTKPISEKPANADTPEYRQHVYDVLGQRAVEEYEEARRRERHR